MALFQRRCTNNYLRSVYRIVYLSKEAIATKMKVKTVTLSYTQWRTVIFTPKFDRFFLPKQSQILQPKTSLISSLLLITSVATKHPVFLEVLFNITPYRVMYHPLS